MTDNKIVRTRVAPSPTGAPHIGTAYIALFNYAFAKKYSGQFILRIEDTDQTRSTIESETEIFNALQWVGINADESPATGGDKGPYRQSERTDIYREHCKTLVETGKAYPCFCSSERLTELRKSQLAAKEMVGYDGLCSTLSKEDAQKRIDNGEQYVIRMRVPETGDCIFNDRLRGKISIPWAQVDQQVLMKSDGFPTYHLANVVDDHLMEITHVIRGEEWINSTPKHVLLYQHFGWDTPEFVHLPLLRNPDQSKLSKRKNPTSILYYQRAGYLPQAVLNYLGLMGYSMPDGSEIFSLEKFIESFDIDRISLGGPIFDLQKLANFNGQYLRELTADTLLDELKKWNLNDSTWKEVIPLAQPRLKTLADLMPMATFLFTDKLEYESESLLNNEIDAERATRLLKISQWELETLTIWNTETIQTIIGKISEKENIKTKKLLAMFFIAITGKKVSLPLFDSMVLLGRDLVLRRIHYALEALAADGTILSGKKLKKLQKEYNSIYGNF